MKAKLFDEKETILLYYFQLERNSWYYIEIACENINYNKKKRFIIQDMLRNGQNECLCF